MDYKNTLFRGLVVHVKNGKLNTGWSPLEYAKRMEDMGVGELIVTSIEREGTGRGYDLKTLSNLSEFLSIPIVASGGAGKFPDFIDARDTGHVQAVAAGSMFIFYGPHRAVLINYPSYETVITKFSEN
jgi:cyclase